MPANLEWIDDYPEEEEQDVVICLNKGLLDGKFPIITEHTNIGDILLIEAMADSTGIPDSTRSSLATLTRIWFPCTMRWEMTKRKIS